VNNMLSKVISGRDPRAQVAVFPFVTINPVEAGSAHSAGGGDAGSEAAAVALRETVRVLEAKQVSERRQAFEEGRREGEQQARAEMQPVLERMNSSINEITSMRPDLRRRAEKDVVQLALLIARRVLHRELAVDENALTAIARVAFERLTRSESYTVTVNPRFGLRTGNARHPFVRRLDRRLD
jgi:flagellar assembly protein FliH